MQSLSSASSQTHAGHTNKPASTTLTRTPSDRLAPRIFSSSDIASQGVLSLPNETMKEIFEVSESPARLSSSKSSPSEFEFSMSFQGQDSSHEQTMLAADELFHDGKLLPLYNTPTGIIATEPVISQRRSSAGEYGMQVHARADEVCRMKVEQHPISPKAPTCTSRWKELLGLKKMQVQDASNCSRLQKKSSHPSNGMAPGRRSVDSLKDPNAGRRHIEMLIHHCTKDVKPTLIEGHSVQQSSKEFMPRATHGEVQAQHALLAPCVQRTHATTSYSSSIAHSELPQLLPADPGLCPTTNLQIWQLDRGITSSRSSKSSNESDGAPVKAPQSRCNAGGQVAVVKQRSRVKSPAKQNDHTRHTIVAMSPRRGGAGPKGMSLGRSGGGSRSNESSRSSMTTRLVVRGLDRSYSSPKPSRKRPEQFRSGRQRASIDGSRTLERSYSAGVRVAPVINVPMYITPSLRKGTKTGIFGLSNLFSSKKDKAHNKLCSNALHSHLSS